MMLAQFQHTGHNLASRGLICSQSGNISVRNGSRQLCITRRGCALSSLKDDDLILTGIYDDDPNTKLASSELEVHRAIYKKTSAGAIVHAHPPYIIALSFCAKEIEPCDLEGMLKIGNVPVIGDEFSLSSVGGHSNEVSGLLVDKHIVVVRGHGSFAVGKSLEEAFDLTVTLEQCCHILYLRKSMGHHC